jgi:ubiquinone/menaquinone biosynthesis C-methylase UbiE
MSERPKSAGEFTAWNEEMVRRFDPDAYHTRSPLPIRAIERLRVRAVARLLAAGPGTRVLEVGCGGGNVLEGIGGRRFGLDLSPWILAKARRRLGPSVGLVRGDAAALPFAEGKFDRVFCSEVLEHVLKPEAVVAEMRRVLAPGGRVVVSVPNESLINGIKGLVFRVPFARRLLGGGGDGYEVAEKMDDEWHLHEFGRERLEQAVRGVFSVRELVGIPANAMPLRWVARLDPL